ncbi:2-oxoisovalerate dehydrogenase [Actinomadura graeca]|uniref:dihydrolipoyllysine-residue succinyltransferase n=1 Tax=Actinomadura graeca TaxID=2750812 RepID=A0ABX8QRY6_9ACTN|nr:dehydrogenase E1 component subunit alpha/beta [Actinomadura graeca]QXJ21161.1 2-oxoisovalerate dehydrogenase [Actinomadura graeca]
MKDDRATRLYRTMALIRGFETAAARLLRAGELSGNLHLSLGQEAVAAGVCDVLAPSDTITTTHRGHGHCLAKGGDPRRMFAELTGRVTGYCKGRAGSMHIADPGSGILGATAIVGGGLPIAVGAAWSAQVRGTDEVAVAFFGDGAVAEGAFHESLNLAALWRLPVVFVCENNQYAELLPTDMHLAAEPYRLAEPYGIPGVRVDGNDALAVRAAAEAAVGRARSGAGPTLLECVTYRTSGHYEGDPQRYRDRAEVEEWRRRDPLDRLRPALPDGLAAEIDALTETSLEAAAAAALGDPEATAVDLLDDVYGEHRGPVPAAPVPATGPGAGHRSGRTIKYREAVAEALGEEMERDPAVVVFGEDVARAGGTFLATRGLLDRFGGSRVRDTPISEGALIGAAVGAAMTGLRPVVEIMFADFLTLAADQLVNHAAKMRSVSGGEFSVPMVVRVIGAAGKAAGPQHGQSLEGWLAHVPGLKVVAPGSPADLKGLLKSAVRDPDPVIVLESLALWGLKGEVPGGDHLVPIGRAAVTRPGTDVSLVTWGAAHARATEAARLLDLDGIDAEVVDLRSLMPLDREAVLATLRRTGRLVVVHDAVAPYGPGAEIAALAAGPGFAWLKAPVRRVAPPFAHVPLPEPLQRAYYPGAEEIAAAARESLTAAPAGAGR